MTQRKMKHESKKMKNKATKYTYFRKKGSFFVITRKQKKIEESFSAWVLTHQALNSVRIINHRIMKIYNNSGLVKKCKLCYK